MNSAAIVIPSTTWARLSNIDDAGKWIENESFSVGGQKIERFAGRSAGRILQSFVLLRKEKPEYFKEIEVYCQPASNVDTVIFCWMQEALSKKFPASVHQRDLFSGALSEPSRTASAIGQEITCWIGGKMTSRLQLTDTDFAHVFKEKAKEVKSRLVLEISLLSQKLNIRPDFSCGAYEIMRITFESHMATKTQLEASNLLLSALRRNGMLSWRPHIETKQLLETSTLSWAERHPEGSQKIPAEWFEKRKSWIDSETKLPIQPEWSPEASEEKDIPAIEDEKAVSIEFTTLKKDFSEYLSIEAAQLLLHPEKRLLEDAKLTMDEKLFTLSEKLKTKVKKVVQKAKSKVDLKANLLKLQDSLPSKSRAELFKDNVPQVQGKKRKVASEAQKLKEKLKLSTLLKNKLKTKQKAEKTKKLNADLKSSSAEAKAIEDAVSELNMKGKKVRVISEAAAYAYAWEGTVKNHVGGQVELFEPGLGKVQIFEDQVQLTDGLKPASSFKPLTQFKRFEKQLIISALNIEADSEDLKVFPASDEYTDDQHINQMLEFLKWQFQGEPDLKRVHFVHTDWVQAVAASLAEDFHDEEQTNKLAAYIRGVFQQFDLLLLPVFRNGHWTLLSIQKEAGSFQIKYFDSLNAERQDCRELASHILSILSPFLPSTTLPGRWNFSRQSGALCGFFVISYIEELLRNFLGQGLAAQRRAHPENVKKWKVSLRSFGTQLETELLKMSEDTVKQKEKEDAKALKLAKSLKFKSIDEMKKRQEKELEEIAKQLLSEKKHFDASQLSEISKKRIERVQLKGLGI